ncbi:hypothetical protein BJ973_003834 [Actinoplanes tereljensis]|uniref:Uncharacterized protein n=1 Tax=Paractinoplanes tereljensis TaxID=571912 RepID=A0A919NYA5_9ACTN|nr:hypothetical protein [Actinoplanes tereljensis]GIF25557.1 hypothetical protein Ate02nite_82870 [Actinoplanes tereljensis]
MTDEQLDRMVRDADPYRPEVIGQLDGAGQTLIEEIMSEPIATRSLRRRLVTAVAAAAVLITALGVSVALRNHPGGPDRQQALPVTSSPSTAKAAGTYSQLVLRAAEQNPRLLIEEAGWKATTVYGFTEDTGTIAFTKGALQLEFNWYPANTYPGYYESRLKVSKPEAATVAGLPGFRFKYSDSDWAIQLKPKDSTFVELRTGGNWTRARFDEVVATIVRADVPTWLAALPPEIVTPGKADEAADKVLADIPLPPKFDKAKLAGLGVNDPYQFTAGVTSAVGCGWIEEFLRAKTAGDQAAMKKATDALSSSHNWKALKALVDEGDWAEAFWELADKVATGTVPDGYKDWIGCK